MLIYKAIYKKIVFCEKGIVFDFIKALHSFSEQGHVGLILTFKSK